MTEIEKVSGLAYSDLFNFHSTDSDPIYNSLIDLRFQDYYLKRKYESLGYLIYNKAKETELPVISYGKEPNWSSRNEEITFGFGMTNSQGLSDIKFKVAPNCILGIQIQGESFRLFVEDSDSRLANLIKDKLLMKSLWFQFSVFGDRDIYPKGNKEFNKYGNTFYYKSVKLGVDLTIYWIVNTVINYLHQINNNLTTIKDLINYAS